MNNWTLSQAKRHLSSKLLLLIAMVAVALNSYAEEFTPKAFSANYSVEYGGVDVADVALEFTTDTHLQLVTESKAKGIAKLFKSGTQREVSLLETVDGILRGNSYSSTNISTRRSIRGKARVHENRELDVKFDWEASTASYKDDDRTREIELKPGSLDRQALSVLVRYELRKATASNPAARPPVVDYHFVDRATLRHYKMVYQGDEEIQSKFGLINTAKYSDTRGNGKQTILWLAEDHDWLPVRFDKVKPSKPTLSMRIK